MVPPARAPQDLRQGAGLPGVPLREPDHVPPRGRAGAAAGAPLTFQLLAGGAAAFARILRRIELAQRTVLLRCFEWRDDDTGQAIARALLAAADRGVAVTILKDRLGGFYEHLSATKQSFFHKRIGLHARWQLWGLMMFYGRWGSLRQRPSPLARALAAHPNVGLTTGNRFDHAKLFVFDDRALILGGMGIGDESRDHNVDFMVEIDGADAVERLADRHAGRARFDAGRPFDFLLHSFSGSARTGEALAAQRLALIAGARHRLTIAMAYLGDAETTRALCDAVRRGVAVTLLTGARADVGGDLNLFTCAKLLRQTGHPAHLRLVLHPRMVHAKAVVGDGTWVDLGSTNFTQLSHGGYEELNVFSREPAFAQEVERAILREAGAGTAARLPLDYRRWRLGWELLITRIQTDLSRIRPRAARPARPPAPRGSPA